MNFQINTLKFRYLMLKTITVYYYNKVSVISHECVQNVVGHDPISCRWIYKKNNQNNIEKISKNIKEHTQNRRTHWLEITFYIILLKTGKNPKNCVSTCKIKYFFYTLHLLTHGSTYIMIK